MAGGRRGPGRPQLSRSMPPPPIHATNVVHGGNSSSQGSSVRHRGGAGGSGGNAPPTTLITITPIRHPDIPNLPTEGSLLFEAHTVIYLLTALFLQYINIYKTVWWLPLAPSNTAMNFHLIDPYLLVFVTLVLIRRLIWHFIIELSPIVTNVTVAYCLLQVLKVIITLSFLNLGLWCLWQLMNNNSPLNLLFLAYPLISYFLLYGLTLDINLSQLAPPAKGSREEHLWNGITMAMPVKHKCSHMPSEIRQEADRLKMDFNSRVKSVLFNSMVCAYYVGFVPICFLQPAMYLDLWWSCFLIAFVWINSFVMFGSHFLPVAYCDALHRCSLHLGRWQKMEHGYSNTPQHLWSDTTVWPQGVLVRYNKGIYRATGQQNVAFPSDRSYARFYFMFHDPLRVLNLFVFLQLGVIATQLYLLIRHSHWHYVISLSLLLFCNYYVLFKLLRNRFILGKVYRPVHDEME
ncbi:transmembrane protein 39A-A-like [Diadema antillarum]|uniref:transmembrane protein 39A-A-like n=1 Tax=Diadema antillarum TaxID=105358 RepID=UPI003A87721A